MSDPRAALPPAQHQIIYQQVVRPPSNGAATAALVLGLVAIVCGVWIPVPILGLFMMFLAFVPAVLAIVFGHLGLRKASVTDGLGRGSSIAGAVLGYVTVAISVATTAVWILAAVAASSPQQ